jgi:Sulfate permease family
MGAYEDAGCAGPMFRLARGLSPSSYRREWLAKDVVAGIVLSTLLVPQGMAYAELAGLPPITGLYTSILCLLGYAVFGPSRILVLGPDSSLGPMIAATIPAAGRRQRRPQASHRARVDARAHGRRDPGPRGRGQARVHRRPDLQADDDRLHDAWRSPSWSASCPSYSGSRSTPTASSAS